MLHCMWSCMSLPQTDSGCSWIKHQLHYMLLAVPTSNAACIHESGCACTPLHFVDSYLSQQSVKSQAITACFRSGRLHATLLSRAWYPQYTTTACGCAHVCSATHLTPIVAECTTMRPTVCLALARALLCIIQEVLL